MLVALLTGSAGEARLPAATPTGTVGDIGVGLGSVTVVAAGDIARDADDGRATARLVRRLAPDAVLALGDNVYDRGTLSEFLAAYDPTWGTFRGITRPVPGNHEYRTRGARGYFAYFERQVRGHAYYAWTAGTWRMYALNCEIPCGRGSAQLAWLRADLAAHDQPALAYVHRPRFSCSTNHPPDEGLRPVWRALTRAGGRIMLAGHNHAYERFAVRDAAGALDGDGLRQFVVGTGGVGFYALTRPCRHRQAGDDRHFGVLRLVLRPTSYSWQFIGVGGQVRDSGRAAF